MFTPPNFNLFATYWPPPLTPSGGPSPIVTPAQLYIDSHGRFGRTSIAVNAINQPCEILRIPSASIKTSLIPLPMTNGIFGIPTIGMGVAYYKVTFWDVIHEGFPNEYVYIQVIQCTAAGTAPDSGR